MKPTLLILAAGMGSRYGGLKQLDGLGPGGETIMDYSVYDALQAGFGKIVFVIRHSFEKEFRDKVVAKYAGSIPVEVVFQELDSLPEGFTLNPEREKPWGTNHALIMAKTVIDEPFGLINADDFYGRESFRLLAQQLASRSGQRFHYCMIGYLLGNTLSESGSVSRGVCEAGEDGYLQKIVERTHIERVDGVPCFKDESGVWQKLQDSTPVSMNMWGFTPDYFELSEQYFRTFLQAHQHQPKAELQIPTVVNHLVTAHTIKVQLLHSAADWFGVTYIQDRPQVVQKINELIQQRVYPSKLF
jgi:dTDP-glucose pyrophosphorylase